MTAIGFITRNLFRRPALSTLTLLCLVVAFLLFILLRSIAIAFSGGYAGIESAYRLNTGAKYSMIDMLPMSHIQRIENVDGVEKIAHATWFGGWYQDPTNELPIFPVVPEDYFDIFAELEISDEEMQAFIDTRTGMVAPRSIAEENEWSVGDRIPIGGQIYSREGDYSWEFDLVGVYDMPTQMWSGVLINFDYFDEARDVNQGTIGWMSVRVSDPNRAPEIAHEIDQLFENSSDPTTTMTESEANRDFFKQFGDITLMMNSILLAVFFTILLLTANTLMHSLRDRIPEIAVLKTLGFGNTKLFLYVICEALILCLLGAGLGMVLGSLAVMAISTDAFTGFAALTGATLAWGVAIAISMGLLLGLAPAITANRLTIVEALHKR